MEEVWISLLFLVYIPSVHTLCCVYAQKCVTHGEIQHKENTGYTQPLVISPEDNHAEVMYGSEWLLSCTPIPAQTHSCQNRMSFALFSLRCLGRHRQNLTREELDVFEASRVRAIPGYSISSVRAIPGFSKSRVRAIPGFSKSSGGTISGYSTSSGGTIPVFSKSPGRIIIILVSMATFVL